MSEALVDFEKFSDKFNVSGKCEVECGNNEISNKYLSQVFNDVGGGVFNNGVFVTYDKSSSILQTQSTERFFTKSKGGITCFARDWLNRRFAISHSDHSCIFRFDVVYNEVIEIPVDIKCFFESELLEYSNDLLAENFFNDWRQERGAKLSYGKCVD